MKDFMGRTLEEAKAVIGNHYNLQGVTLVKGVWVAEFLVGPDKYASPRAWKNQKVYAALSASGKMVSNGTRKDTIALAKETR